MDRVLRYCLDVVFNAIGVLIGIALVTYSIVTGYSVALVFLFVARVNRITSEIPDSARGAVPQEFARYNEITIATMLQFAVPLLLAFIAGSALLFFGGRGAIRRLAAGLPSESEGRAETGVGRWGSVVAYMFGILVAASTGSGYIRHASVEVPIVFAGTNADGIIMDKTPVPNAKRPREPGSILGLHLKLPGGEAAYVKLNVDFVNSLPNEIGKTIKMRYPPGNPVAAVPVDWVPSPLMYIWGIVWRIGFIYLGLRGIQRNLGASPGGSGRTPNASAPETSYAAHVPRPQAGARAQFGRRSPTRQS